MALHRSATANMLAHATPRKALWRGFLIGAGAITVLGLFFAWKVISGRRPSAISKILLIVPLFPGLVALYLTLSAYGFPRVSIPGFSVPRDSWGMDWLPWVFFFVVNGVFYGLVGGGIAVLRHRRAHPWSHQPETPLCTRCGHPWDAPVEPKCPKCGSDSGFEQWMNKPIPGAQCTNCGYDLRGSEGDRCPECEEPFSYNSEE